MDERGEVLRNWHAERPTSRNMSRYTTWMRALLLLPFLSSLVACGDDSSSTDAGESDSSVDAGFDGGPPEDCDTPGAVEDVACGRCGTIERFCSADGVWVFMGECTGEGVCDPGTTEDVACGMCGMQASRCTDTCEWEAAGACMNETGECTPGETQTTSDGCSGEDVRELTCSATCAFEETLECGPPPGVDVMFLLHTPSSRDLGLPAYTPDSSRAARTMRENFYEPVSALGPNVAVGVVRYSDFNALPYGSGENSPGILLQEPSTSPFDAGSATADLFDGGFGDGDPAASGVVALASLVSTPHPAVTPSSCSLGREGWGCWRARSRRIVVLMSDVPHHGGPTGDGEHQPYTSIDPAAPEWSDVAGDLMAGVDVMFAFVDPLNSAVVGTDVAAQHRQMLVDVGQPETNLVVIEDGMASAAYDDLVARIGAAL